MSGEMKAVVGGAGVDFGKLLGWSLAFVSADAESDDVAVAELDGQIENLGSFFCAELPDGVEDPEHGDTEVFFAALAAAFEAFEDGGEILLAPEADADGDDYLENILHAEVIVSRGRRRRRRLLRRAGYFLISGAPLSGR